MSEPSGAVVSAPSRADPVARGLSGFLGGPAGNRLADGRGLVRALPVLVLLATLTLGLGVVAKGSCYLHGWNSPDQFTHTCYSDIAVLYGSSHLGDGQRPTLIDALGSGGLGQPPLTGAAIWALSGVVDGSAPDAARQFFNLSAVVLAALLGVAVIAVGLAVGRRRSWDGAHLALSPVLITVGLVNYDLLAVCLVSLALLAWSRGRAVLAGLLLGGAILCRPVLTVIAVALLAACLRGGLMGRWWRLALPALVVWVAARIVLFESPAAALGNTWLSWRGSTPGYGSLWLVPQLARNPSAGVTWYTGPIMTGTSTTAAALLSLVLVAMATLFLALAAPYRPRVAHLALFALAFTLLSIKSLPLQASLLLLPFVALSGLKWRDHLIWAGAEVTYFIVVWQYIASESGAPKGAPAGLYLVALLLRCAAIAYLGVQAARAAWRPWHDPVRVPVDPADDSQGEDDPAGGPLALRPDALVIRFG